MSISRIDQHARLALDENVALHPGWVSVDLARLPSGRLAHAATISVSTSLQAATWLPGLPAAERSKADWAERKRQIGASSAKPLATDKFIVIGSGHPLPRSVRRRPVVPPIANDNIIPRSPFRRRVLREVFFLGVLAVTILGAFVTGRAHSIQRVIVVPEPMSPRSMLG